MIHLTVYLFLALYRRMREPDNTFEARSYGGM